MITAIHYLAANYSAHRPIRPGNNRLVIGAVIAMLAAPVLGAPAVQQVSGNVDHGASVTITGTGFGAKASAAPVVWDTATGTSILSKWDGAWPSNNPTYNTEYRAMMRGISMPHGRVTKYIAGAHGNSGGADAGYNVIFFKNFSVTSYPFHYYASWYGRVDDAWQFGGDNNFKTFAFSAGNGPYGMPNNWYVNYGPPTFSSKTASPQWQINDDGASLQIPDANGHGSWWAWGLSPIAAGWIKTEIAVRLSQQSDGYIKQWENGKLVIDYRGPTDKYSGTSRTVGIGGYVRNYGYSSNWRYFSDVYLDYSLARVVLANSASLGQATIIENQIPSAWSANSIGVTVNLGKFTGGQTAYLFVVDSTGSVNSAGYPVTVGGTSATPKPPTNAVAQ